MKNFTYEPKIMKRKINLTITPDVYEQYKEYCSKYGYKISPRVELLIKRDMEENKISLNDILSPTKVGSFQRR